MKTGWYFHRLRAMSLPELVHRLSERWKHRSDAVLPARLKGISPGVPVSGVPALPSPGEAPVVLKEQLAEDAARLQSGRWRLFGWREVQVTTPPDWQKDPTGVYRAPPDRLARTLDHRSLPEGADVRTIWEINRWSEMTRLAMHGWINGDSSAISTAQDWLENWIEVNPVGYGLHWTSPLEAGLRLINFTWFDALVVATGDPALQARQKKLAEGIVVPHAAWIWRYKSFGSSANNHLLGELVGLLHTVKRWPALEVRIASAAILWQGIERCVLSQFAADGGNREQALHYHLFAWEMAWHAARIIGATTGPVMDRLGSGAGFFAKMIHAAEPWNYGDSDDAEVVPLGVNRQHAEGEWQSWVHRMPGGEALRYWLGPPPATTRAAESAVPGDWWVAPESGMAVLDADGWKLRLDASPLGFGAMAAHGHGDALHLSIWDGDQALVIDPGTGGYYGMKELRSLLAAWSSHNGPQPPAGFKTPRRMGTFLLMDHHGIPRILEGTDGLVASIKHEGQIWRRRVFQDAASRIHVVDDSTPPGAAGMRTRWYLSPEIRVEPLSSTCFRLRRRQLAWQVKFEGESTCVLQEGLASRRYGDFEKCPVLEVTGHLSIKSVWSRE